MQEILKIMTVTVLAFAAGIVQSISGFGNAIVMMLGFPSVFGITEAAAVSGSIGAANNVTLTLKYKKGISAKSIRKTIWIAAIYTTTSILIINFTKYINVRTIGVAYGVFLILLAGYFVFLDGKVKLLGWFWLIFSALISGIGTGLFSIGGPLLAVYFSQIFAERDEYISNLQLVFFIGGIISFVTRIATGIYTLDMVKYSIAGIVAAYAGSLFGMKLVSVIKPKIVRTIMYALVLVAGIMTLTKYL